MISGKSKSLCLKDFPDAEPGELIFRPKDKFPRAESDTDTTLLYLEAKLEILFQDNEVKEFCLSR